MAGAENPCKIFVGNLPYSMNHTGLAMLFRPFGTVVGAKMVEDRGTGKKKGFGFITFETPDSVERAIARMHEVDCEGRRLTVRKATMRGEKAIDGDAASEDEEGDKGQQPSEQGWGTASSRRNGNGPPSFQKRAEAKSKAGKLLGWGAADDDWA